jgi:hypothetical protein
MSRPVQRRDDDLALEVEAEVRAFEAGDIDPGQFDHEAHVRVVWCYLQQFPVAVTIAKFTASLRALTVRFGMPQKYHETISWFFIIVIADRVAGSAACTWEDFRTENRDLIENGSALLRQHYSADHLNSTEARQRFVLPDRCCRLASEALHQGSACIS